MAQFQRANGDNLPVLNYDSGSYVNSGANAVQSNVPIQPQGPYLAFFTVTGTGALSGTQIKAIITTAEQLATVMVYEYYNATNDSVALALYPIDAWTTTDLQANIDDALTGAGIPNTVTVTNQAIFVGDEYEPDAPSVPSAPTIGTATALSTTTARVTFTPEYDGGSAITSYTVTSSPGGITATGTASPITVTGLTTGTTYTFTVTATNSVGTGAASAASNSARTWSVPGAPTVGTATDTGATTATLAFTAPAIVGGTPITGYNVVSTPAGGTGSGLTSPISVTGLTTGTSYTFAVTATNAIGTGAASAASNSVTTWAVPGAPTVGTATAASPTTATLTFTAGTTGGTPITSYTVTSTPPGGIAAAGTTSPLSITGLTTATAYTFVVKAVNAIGAGANSAASNSITTP
jgi:hypothetical protein